MYNIIIVTVRRTSKESYTLHRGGAAQHYNIRLRYIIHMYPRQRLHRNNVNNNNNNNSDIYTQYQTPVVQLRDSLWSSDRRAASSKSSMARRSYYYYFLHPLPVPSFRACLARWRAQVARQRRAPTISAAAAAATPFAGEGRRTLPHPLLNTIYIYI